MQTVLVLVQRFLSFASVSSSPMMESGKPSTVTGQEEPGERGSPTQVLLARVD